MQALIVPDRAPSEANMVAPRRPRWPPIEAGPIVSRTRDAAVFLAQAAGFLTVYIFGRRTDRPRPDRQRSGRERAGRERSAAYWWVVPQALVTGARCELQ